MQVQVDRLFEIFLGALENRTIECVGGRLVDEDARAELLLQFTVKFGYGLCRLLSRFNQRPCFADIAVAKFDQRANSAFQIEGHAAGVGGATLGHIGEGQQF